MQKNPRPPGGEHGISLPSFIRTITVGFGIAPNLLTRDQEKTVAALAGSSAFACPLTAGGEFHPALKTGARYALAGPGSNGNV